jgi:hypothetical protein
VVNTIKIDAALVADLTNPGGQSRIIVDSIVKLCFSLGVCTVAEAVETAEQVAILRGIGAGAAQGYFFSRPLSAGVAFALASMSPLPHFSLSDPDWDEIHAGFRSSESVFLRKSHRNGSVAGYLDELRDHAAAMRAVGVPLSAATEN